MTPGGQLVTVKYEEGFAHGDYCVATTEAEEVVAVTCNPCSMKVKSDHQLILIQVFLPKRRCINLCCPHGQAFLPNVDYDYNDYDSPSHVCAKAEGLEYQPEVWHKEQERILNWERNTDYVLVAPGIDKTTNGSAGFQCPKEFAGVTWAPEDI